jgi:hypothetical protein
MKRTAEICVALAMAMASVSCGKSGSAAKQEAVAQKPVAPEVPNYIQAAATNDLGSEAEVLVYGDLAKNGRTQALVVNRLKVRPPTAVPGILVSRVSIIEKDDGHWKEIFRCDQHLQNPKGYLARNPLVGVGSWRLQYEQDPKKGLALYFTPLNKPGGADIQTLGVLWNPAVNRYETMDPNYQHFLTEQPTLEIPQAPGRL